MRWPYSNGEKGVTLQGEEEWGKRVQERVERWWIRHIFQRGKGQYDPHFCLHKNETLKDLLLPKPNKVYLVPQIVLKTRT